MSSKALKLAKQATEDAKGKNGDKGKKDDKGKGVVVPPKGKRVPTVEELAKRANKGIVILDGKDLARPASKDKTTTHELEQLRGKRKGKEVTTTSPKKTKVATEEVPKDLSLIQVVDGDIFGVIVQSIDVMIARLHAYRVATLSSGQQYSGRGDQIAELNGKVEELGKEVSTITAQKQLLEKVNEGHVSRIQELTKAKEELNKANNELTTANKELTASLQRTEEALGTALSDMQEMEGKNLELKEALRDIFDDSFNNAVKQIVLCNRSIDLELALINKNYIVKGNCLVEEEEGQPDEVIKDFGPPVCSGAANDMS